jgi:hypothetical protein
MSKKKHSQPVRSLLVYGDGRVYEYPEPLYGYRFFLTERHDDGKLTERLFSAEYAVNTSDDYAMVFVERDPKKEDKVVVPVEDLGHRTIVSVDVPKAPKDARGYHKDCLSRGGHQTEGHNDACKVCGLSGYVIRTMVMLDERDDRERKETATLRDQLGRMRDELRDIKVENSDLRRRLDRK